MDYKTVKQIYETANPEIENPVKIYLDAIGADSLCKEDCGCKIEKFLSCEWENDECVPAIFDPDTGYCFPFGNHNHNRDFALKLILSENNSIKSTDKMAKEIDTIRCTSNDSAVLEDWNVEYDGKLFEGSIEDVIDNILLYIQSGGVE